MNSFLGCRAVYIGSSDAKSKIFDLRIDENLICPKLVNKDNWIIGSDWEDKWIQATDTFSIEQRSTKLTITRTDWNGGWGLSLAFHCCFQGIRDVTVFKKICLVRNEFYILNSSITYVFQNDNSYIYIRLLGPKLGLHWKHSYD